MTLAKFKMTMHKTIAGFMAIWLSGVVFLFCCEKINGTSVTADSCPLAKMSSHCDKAARAYLNSPVIERTDAECVDCCGFLPAIFDKARNIERTQKEIAVTLKPVALRFKAVYSGKYPAPITTIVRSHVADKQTTFVQNCVFRI